MKQLKLNTVLEECDGQGHHDSLLRISHFLSHYFSPLVLNIPAIKARINVSKGKGSLGKWVLVLRPFDSQKIVLL